MDTACGRRHGKGKQMTELSSSGVSGTERCCRRPRGGLFFLFFCLLFGGFSYSMLAYVLIPTLMPIILDDMGADGALIGLIVGSIPAAMNMVMNPILSTNSDRFRSRWGRRIPFLAVAAPFVTLFMILIGWMPQIVEILHRWSFFARFDIRLFGLVLICVVGVLFQFFNLIVGSIYYYLLPDVIPQRMLGRFMSLMNIAFACSGFVFNYFLMEYARTAAPWVFTGVGLFFLVSYLFMCLNVREGSYPPPEVLTRSGDPWYRRFPEWLKGDFAESFGSLFFVMLFTGTALNQTSTACRNIFNLLFATKELMLTEAQFGKVMGVGALISLAVMVVVGYVMDKLHPLRIYIASGLLVILVNILGYFWVYDYKSFYVIGILIVIVYSIQNLSNVPMFAALFPRERFGQFSSANAMLNSLFMIVANYLGGLAVDYFGYRFIFVWDTFFTLLATCALLYVYVIFLRRGGCKNYTPPI